MKSVNHSKFRFGIEVLEDRQLLTVSVAGGPYIVDEGQSLILDASQSSNVRGGLLAYTWDINGDGVYSDASGVNPTIDWSLFKALGITDGPDTRAVSVRANDTTFDGSAVAALSQSFYQQNSIFLPGLGVLIGQGNQTLYESYWGNYNNNTVVQIASGSKLMTSVVFMRLVGAGLMELDAPLANHLPGLTWSDPLKQTITLRQALSHTTGLPGNSNSMENASSIQTAAVVIASSSVAMEAIPGTSFEYGNVGMQLAAAAAEHVTGLSWENVFQQYVATPLGMSATYGSNSNPIVAGSGRVKAQSYGSMLNMLVHHGTHNGQQFLPANLIEEITTVQPGSTNNRGNFYQDTAFGYGFGQWIIGQDPQGRTTQLLHFGSNGFKGAWDRETGLWLVVLMRDTVGIAANNSGPYFQNLVNQVKSQINPTLVISPSTALTVLNVAPTANAGGPYSITEGDPLTLSGSGIDPVDSSLTYAWDINGDSVFADATGAAPSLSWPELSLLGITPPNSYNVRLRVDDGDGGITDSSPAHLTVSGPVVATIAGRHIFYNQSKFDGNDAGITAGDDGAIATDKAALQFSGSTTAPLTAFTSYSRGINGIMVDVADSTGTLTLADFTFKVGTSSTVSGWANAPAPSGFSVRAGAGVGGSDRVEIIWANNAIQNIWLQVIVEGNDTLGGNNTNTGLAASDVFFFGNKIGDTFLGSPPAIVSTAAADALAARNNPGILQPITNVYDFDRNQTVSAGDELIARGNAGILTRNLTWTPPADPLVAEGGDDSGSAVALALAFKRDDTQTAHVISTLANARAERGSPAAPDDDPAPLLMAHRVRTSANLDEQSQDLELDVELLKSLAAGFSVARTEGAKLRPKIEQRLLKGSQGDLWEPLFAIDDP